MMSFIDDGCKQGIYWTKGSYWLSWSHHFKRFYSRHLDLVNHYEYLCHKRPRIRFICRNHNRVRSSFILYNPVCNKSNTQGLTDGAEHAYPLGAPKFTPVFILICIAQSLAFYVFVGDHFLYCCPISVDHCIVCPFFLFTASDFY